MALRDTLVRWIPNFLLRTFATPYIAGNSIQSALETADQLWQERQLTSILDLLGEGIQSREDVQKEVEEYDRMLAALGERKHIVIGLKPTQMGLNIDYDYALANIENIVTQAADKGVQVAIDMEESEYVDGTLQLYRTLRQRYDNVGAVLQARLFRTSEDIDTYLDGLQAHIRLCLGIYNEPADIAYTRKPEIKDNYYTLLRKLWEKGHTVGIATHDEVLLQRCLALAEEMDIPQERYEIQMLLGVPRKAVQDKLVKQGTTVSLYVPYGTTWENAYAYSRRRLAENPQMGFYVIKNIFRYLRVLLFGPPSKNKETHHS